MTADEHFTQFYHRHVAMVYRLCFAYLKSPAPTEDAVQETFVKALTKAPRFEGAKHEQAWLARTAGNVCKDVLKSWWRRKISLDDTADSVDPHRCDTTLIAVLALPDKYKSVVYLFYYEGYTTPEIAQALRRPESTVRNHLSEARRILRKKLGESNAEL